MQPYFDKQEQITVYYYKAMLGRKLCMLSCVIMLCSFPLYAENSYKELDLFLQKYINFAENDLIAMKSGKVVSKMLKTKNHSEVAAFGVVRINVSGKLFIDKFRDIVNF